MLGKAMNEFRRSTDDFKRTWEQEIEFENETIKTKAVLNSTPETSIPFENPTQKNTVSIKNEIIAPEIKELNGADLEENFPKEMVSADSQPKSIQTNKRDWL